MAVTVERWCDRRVVERLGVRSWPTIYVIDARGVIRYKNERGEALEKAVDRLLSEAETDGKRWGGNAVPCLGCRNGSDGTPSRSESPEGRGLAGDQPDICAEDPGRGMRRGTGTDPAALKPLNTSRLALAGRLPARRVPGRGHWGVP